MGFIIIWLIVWVIWWVIDRVRLHYTFKELNETIDWINRDLKNRYGKKDKPNTRLKEGRNECN